VTGQLTTSEAREQFSDVINRAAYGKERVILTRRGRALVAVVPIDDVHLLDALEDRMDLDDALAGISEAKTEGTISWLELRARLNLPSTE
jgi:prevent-host-death family protein